MDYYLYSHSNADGIFYIGKGSNGRKDDYARSKEWKDIADKGYTTKVEANGSEKDILALEGKVIRALIEQGVKLVNKMHNKHWDGCKGKNNNMYGKPPVRGMLGKHHSEESKRKISASSSGEKSHLFGTKHSDERKKKISASVAIANRKKGQRNRLERANNYRRNGDEI